MAKPRVFISSTYYDLKHVRTDVAKFLDDIGYEPVLFERGEVPYGRDQALEQYCYKEISLCDILVSIVGGRYGTKSSANDYSITQTELKEAITTGKQVYIFVDKNVLSEYKLYQLNKENGMKFFFAEDVKVHEFLDELYSLQNNKPMFPFESPQEIVDVLRDQFAGLFQRLLQQEAESSHYRIINDLGDSVATLQQLVKSLSTNMNEKALEKIIEFNHPVFTKMKSSLGITHRVAFINLNELSSLLKAYGYKPDESLDESVHVWIRASGKTTKVFQISKAIFDDNLALKPVTALGVIDDDIAKAYTLNSVDFNLDEDVPF